jgi:hypothetical protein
MQSCNRNAISRGGILHLSANRQVLNFTFYIFTLATYNLLPKT